MLSKFKSNTIGFYFIFLIFSLFDISDINLKLSVAHSLESVVSKVVTIYCSNELLQSLTKELSESISNEELEVRTLIPAKSSWHQYSLTPSDINALSRAQTLYLLGKDIEGFSKLELQAKLKSLKIIEMNQEIPLKDVKDPHFWNHPLNYLAMAKSVSKSLISLNPNWKNKVENSLKKVEQTVTLLHKNYELLFSKLNFKTIVIAHNSISFLGKAYGIVILSPTGFNSLDHTIPSDLIAIKNTLKENPKIPIFRETNANNIFIEKLAKDLNLKISGDINGESISGKSYVDYMKNNLDLIYNALKMAQKN